MLGSDAILAAAMCCDLHGLSCGRSEAYASNASVGDAATPMSVKSVKVGSMDFELIRWLNTCQATPLTSSITWNR